MFFEVIFKTNSLIDQQVDLCKYTQACSLLSKSPMKYHSESYCSAGDGQGSILLFIALLFFTCFNVDIFSYVSYISYISH